ncbi:transcription termination factor NusA [Aliarcobacter skirrowii]|uniref:transcription termination factor NusA n=1 Tax=Aliarcobacter skirrowii TaxID=28200 RepID=UPI002A2892E5|nr:transcription termination factor NusA [Aliarcobacter skirrowii]MDD3025147.1 transcription termination factor NusA [Aliarcobacter skirrowii]MDY0180925.1 transcription termination factor NusA [Aliarcobacter skirrowii]
MDKIIDILDSIAYEKGLKITDVEAALKEALIKTAQKMVDHSLIFDAKIDRANKKLILFQKIEVVANDDKKLQDGCVDSEGKPLNKENFISIDEAKAINSDLELGDFLSYELEFENMGRNAAVILSSNFEYRLQRFIEENIMAKYKEKVGKTVSAVVTRVDKADNTFIEIGEIKGILQRKNRIKGEKFKVGDTLKAVVRGVNIDKNLGLIVDLSRTSPKFLENLLAVEVPELKDEKIIIEASARIPGTRSKIALNSLSPTIDAIGAVVGVKGVRINSVSKELNGENIDCVEYSSTPEIFIARALSPAIVNSVVVETEPKNGEKGKAIVTINSEQKSKAIGKEGLNIRLASMLTKYDIEIKELGSTNINLNDNETKKEETKSDVSSLEALFK